MYKDIDFAVITPLANEERDFHPFVDSLRKVLDRLNSGTVYFIVDRVSRDNTLMLCEEVSNKDKRFTTIWAPENKNVVDAYMKGYSVAFENKHDVIIEMDAGLSHDPQAVTLFLKALSEGNECAFGSRFILGGSMYESRFRRILLSKGGTIISNLMLGTRLHDMTSGYQGFQRSIVGQFIDYPLLSTGHFYQTELRYLLRKKRYTEVPIHYRAPSKNVSKGSISNSLRVLWYYFKRRITLRPAIIE